MDTVLETVAIVGTNSWGSAAYERILRGESVEEEVIREAVSTAIEEGLFLFDTAQDYGFGEGQRMIGRLCPPEVRISSKYTPGTRYVPGQVRRAFEKDLADFGRDEVEIYWLHLPNQIERNLAEMIELYREGKVKHIGVSNFDLAECRRAQEILGEADIPLYGVQNHYSILAREWEKNGLLAWCQENGIRFWGWAVLEEGMLVPPKPDQKQGVMRRIYQGKRKRLAPLYAEMERIGRAHGIAAAQVATAFCATKGVIPVCGCRKPYQVKQLAEAARTRLRDEEVQTLEHLADGSGVKILGEDMFRFAVKKEAGTKRRGPVSAFMNMTRKPTGALGSLMISGMNSGHAKLADWGMRRLPQDGVEMLLDIGCGGGRNVGELLGRYPSAWAAAVDHSLLSVERTEKYNRAAISAGRLAVREEDVSALSFAADTFNLATAFETIYFWPGLVESFAEVYRVLKPGGTFLIINESDGTDAAGQKWEKRIDGMRVYTSAQIADALHAAGFIGVGAWHHRENPWLTMIAVKGSEGNR